MARVRSIKTPSEKGTITKGVRFTPEAWASIQRRLGGKQFSDFARCMIEKGVVRVDGRAVALAAFVDVLNAIRHNATQADLEDILYRYLEILA